jgi:type 1 glutamine amidotransferase
MHVDPAIHVLATTHFPVADGPHVGNGSVHMPVVWTKRYGQGRVFYNSLGHQANIVEEPNPLRLCVRGLLWAAHAEELA